MQKIDVQILKNKLQSAADNIDFSRRKFIQENDMGSASVLNIVLDEVEGIIKELETLTEKEE